MTPHRSIHMQKCGVVIKKKYYQMIQKLLCLLGLNKKNITTSVMRHGIEEEAKAIAEYCRICLVTVKDSGLWIHKKDPHLGASPDGLIVDSEENLCGTVDVKCWKIFRNRSDATMKDNSKILLNDNVTK